VSATLHRDLIRGFARTCGVPMAAGMFLFHQVHLFYSAATLALVTAQRMFGRGPGASTGTP
jgi:hypothetical protein